MERIAPFRRPTPLVEQKVNAVKTESGRVAYGLRIRGLEGVPELCPAGDDDDRLPCVLIRQVPAGPVPAVVPVDGERGVRSLSDGRTLALCRRSATATFYGDPLAPDVLAHPYLSPVATVFNRWAGREVFHSGAFVQDGRAFALLGTRTAGKSSLLAALAAGGVPIVADDIMVVDGDKVYPGPRCIDLREPVPSVRRPGQAVRARTRTRVGVAPVPPRLPLGGWIFLRWGPDLTIRPVSAARLLTRLAAVRFWPQLRTDPATMLTIAARPAWDLTRPRDWSLLLDTQHLIRRALTDAAAAAAVPR
ncbi:hypothetical protein C1I93_26760 [Micromonospora endophytica]|uniref:Hpr(Ser) kinase/phosphatase n=1 Tax=Micromonospora endophytica TaxID=515350 RepID=A0A2W2C538_9ACTN|nr:hypothetical protein C1I93_26760 [Micromonospora endophytica]